jgi:hypothetical protein
LPPKLVDLCGSGPWTPPSLLSIYKLGDGSHQHWYICMVRGHGGHQTRLVYRVWGRGVLWLLAEPRERTQNSRTKPCPKGPEIYFSERSDLAVSFGSGPIRRACKGPGPDGFEQIFVGPFGHGLLQAPWKGHITRGRSQVRKVRQIICRTFRTWPLAGPVKRPRA